MYCKVGNCFLGGCKTWLNCRLFHFCHRNLFSENSQISKKCRNTEFFLVRIFLYSDWIKNLRIWTLFTQSYTWLDFTCIFCRTWWKCKLYVRSLFTDIRGPLTANCLIYDAIENILLEVITLKSFWIDFSPLWIVINCNAIRFKNRFFSEKSKKSIFGWTLYVSFFFFLNLMSPGQLWPAPKLTKRWYYPFQEFRYTKHGQN